ncbi:MAG: 16S rRNA (cytosine(1402)-N(4))-methyltransferase RsmH [Candidatus Omnitrophota bacterium]
MPLTHIPVMCREVIECLNIMPGSLVVDATVGAGGHALEILKKITPGGILIGIDQDADAIAISRENLRDFTNSLILVNDNFRNIKRILNENNIKTVDAILFDLGVSTLQLERGDRGFSFQKEGPLNMRMDKSGQITAYDLVNNLSEEELEKILKMFGEERFSKRIAHSIVKQRKVHIISTTLELVDIISRSVPKRFTHWRIHPATRTFQALRIAVNRELEVLKDALEDAIDVLNPHGRLSVISFHSLEDRIAKHMFRSFNQKHMCKLITKKPMIPETGELARNIRARSAKMRVIEKYER